MPKIKLEVEYDLSGIHTPFEKGEEMLDKQRVSINQLSKDTKTAFSVGVAEADKFANEVKDGTKQVALMDAAAKNLNKVFNETGKPQSLEEQKAAIAEVKKQLIELANTEKTLLDQQNIAGPSNIKKQFDEPIDEARKKIAELKKSLNELSNLKPVAKNTPGAVPGDLPLIPTDGKEVNYLRQVRQEIKNLMSDAIRLRQEGDFIGADEAIKKAGELKDELKDVNDAIKSVAGNAKENLAGAFGKATSLIAQGFEGVLSVQALVGSENKEFEKQLLKLQAIQSISRIAGEFGDLGDRLKEIKLGFAPIANLYTRGNEALKNFGKNGVGSISNVAKETKSLSATISGFVTSGIAGVKSLWATIAANPLGIILVSIAGLITAVVTLKDKIKPFAAIFDFFAVGFKTLFDGLEKLGQYFGIVAGESEKANKRIIASTEETIDAINRLYDYEVKVAEARNRTTLNIEEKRTNDIKEALRQRLQAFKELEKENGKLDEEQVKKRKEILQQLEDAERDAVIRLFKIQNDRKAFLNDQQRQATELRLENIKNDQAREEALLKLSYEKQIEDLKKSFAEKNQFVVGEEKQNYAFFKQSQDRLKAQEERYLNELNAIREKYIKKREEQLKRLLEMERSFRKALLDLTNRADLAAAETDEKRIEVEKRIALESIQVLRDSLIKQGQEVENFQAEIEHRKAKTFKLSSEQEEQLSILQQAVYKDATEKLIRLEVERQTKMASARASQSKVETSNLDLEELNKINSVKLMPFDEDKFNEIEFERAKQQAILSIQREYALKRRNLQEQELENQFNAESTALYSQLELLQNRNDEAAKIERERIEKDLDLLELRYNLERVKINDELDNILTDIANKRKELNKVPAVDLIKLLGLKENDIQNIQAALQSIGDGLGSFIDLQQARLDKEIQQSEERQANNEKEISDIKGKIEKEQALANEGKANNSSLFQAQLNDRIAAQEQEQALAQKNIEEKKRLQKQQLNIDTALQASNIITASTNILKVSTELLGPAGVPTALVAIAAMLTGFTLAKINAYKAVNEGLALKDGIIDIDGPGTETSDSIKARLSKGESVMTAKETRDNKKLFKGIREKNPLFLIEGIVNLLKNTGVTLPQESAKNISEKRDALKEGEIKILFSNKNSELQSELKITNNKLDLLIEEQKNKMFSDGVYLFTIKGGHTTKRKL